MEKQAVIRRIRIAVSVFFGMVTIALLALWMRSRTNIDVAGVVLRTGYLLAFTASRSELELSHERLPSSPVNAEGFAIHSMHLPRFDHETTALSYKINWKTTPQGIRLTAPIWLFAVVAAAIAAGFGFGRAIPARFSVRTLLIATTLVAVVLGLVCYAVQ